MDRTFFLGYTSPVFVAPGGESIESSLPSTDRSENATQWPLAEFRDEYRRVQYGLLDYTIPPYFKVIQSESFGKTSSSSYRFEIPF